MIPAVEHEIHRWESIRVLLGELDTALEVIRSADDGGPVAQRLAGLDAGALLRTAAERLTGLATVRGRLNRSTVNLGVSGRARNGKSTLLQSLSGLDDRQIPTGQGQPVTAVRSRIYHAPDQREARLTMHTVRSFLDEVVAPYHEELGLDPAPATLGDFARFDYRPAEGAGSAAHPKAAPMLARLREMQQALDSYRELLTGRQRTVEMAELRSWVSYPAIGAGSDRRYLAVRDAVITCPFPIDDVIALGLIDLPGLGELVPGAEEHHLAGLRDDVDFVIVVKRPTDTNAMWSAEDSQALQLIGQARGAAALRDFALLLINDGGCEPVNVNALRDDIHRRLNDGVGGRNYWTIQADCADREIVRAAVLGAVLDHLADALPRMDDAVITAVLEDCEAARSALVTAMGDALDGLRTLMAPTHLEEVLARADQLRAEVTTSVQDWVDDNRQRADENHDDVEFHERVAVAQAGIRSWILDGFGAGEQEWITGALSRMRVDKGALPLASQTLHVVRVHLARQFAAIDDVLNRRRDEFWTGLTVALGPRFAHMWDKDQDGEVALRTLAQRIRQSPEPCPGLAETIDFVLDIRLDYHTRILPKLRRALDVLEPEPVNGPPGGLLAVAGLPRSPDGARDLFLQLSQLARQAAYDAGVLLADEPRMAAQVLYAYAEQFEDEFIRSSTSRAEFRRLSAAFRDQLWPDELDGPALVTAHTQHVRGIVHQLITTAR
ncbi:hypothetical protein SAMN04489716_2652 [Actinoplanes derwentensis]|uniref:Dynamin family protein n=2 Tax=Actinoplanes derwentensis TaxID=113562 RepID=A0A1H1Y073_9ACTN|nr:hypothetical protein SAMN04489716_2652 [Actinoplanes derwentensis]